MSKKDEAKADKMDPWILTPVLILTIVEYEVFTFSKIAVAAAKQDAWLAVMVGAFIGIGFVFLLAKLAARFPGKGYFEYLKIVWGKPLGILLAIIYLLFWTLFLVVLFYETSMANTLLFLPKTPKIIPLSLFAISLVILISHGVGPIVRFFQLMLPFLLLPLMGLIILFIPTIDFENFLPILGDGVLPVMKGVFYFLGAYQGPEILLFLAPFISRIDQGVKPAVIGYAIPAFIGWANTAAALGILGVAGIKEALLPGINVVTLIQFPGFPVERFGLLLTMPWLIAIYTTLAIYLYLLICGFMQLFNFRYKKITIWGLTGLIIGLSYFIPNVVWHETLRNCLTLVTPGIVYILPVLTYILAIIRKKGIR